MSATHHDNPPFLDGDYPWTPDRGDGTYGNPVLFADYSDPDAIRVGDTYYLTASSFACTPGLPILESRDLVSWTIIGHAVKNLPHPRYSEPCHGCGIWAPAIRYHDGRFHIFFPMPDEGIYVVTAKSPSGPWGEPRLLQQGLGLIDPCPLWDDDGRAYLVFAYARSRAGIADRLHVRPMEPDCSRLVGEGRVVFHDPEHHPTAEGPKFHKIEGRYYIQAPAGGVSRGQQLILRSDSVYGPYETKVVMTQRGTQSNGPHQGALVDAPDGSWWFLHFQEYQPYGRLVHLQPVRWEDGWPLIGTHHDPQGVGRPVLRHRKPAAGPDAAPTIPQTSDDFRSARLGLQWQWQANHDERWYSLTERPGHLRLRARHVRAADLALAPNLLLQKLPAPSFRVESAVGLDDSTLEPLRAGIAVMGLEHATLALERAGGRTEVVLFLRGQRVHAEPAPTGRAVLTVAVQSGGLCRFGVVGDHGIDWIGETFRAREGHWIGAKVGIYALGYGPYAVEAYADFAFFRFVPLGQEGTT